MNALRASTAILALGLVSAAARADGNWLFLPSTWQGDTLVCTGIASSWASESRRILLDEVRRAGVPAKQMPKDWYEIATRVIGPQIRLGWVKYDTKAQSYGTESEISWSAPNAGAIVQDWCRVWRRDLIRARCEPIAGEVAADGTGNYNCENRNPFGAYKAYGGFVINVATSWDAFGAFRAEIESSQKSERLAREERLERLREARELEKQRRAISLSFSVDVLASDTPIEGDEKGGGSAAPHKSAKKSSQKPRPTSADGREKTAAAPLPFKFDMGTLPADFLKKDPEGHFTPFNPADIDWTKLILRDPESEYRFGVPRPVLRRLADLELLQKLSLDASSEWVVLPDGATGPRLDFVRDGSALRAIGLRSGDVLLEVNGAKIPATPFGAFSLTGNLLLKMASPTLTAMSVEIEREGVKHRIDYVVFDPPPATLLAPTLPQ